MVLTKQNRVLETTDQALIGHIIYYYSISNFANFIVLLQASVTWYAFCPPDFLSTHLVQVLYCVSSFVFPITRYTIFLSSYNKLSG